MIKILITFTAVLFVSMTTYGQKNIQISFNLNETFEGKKIILNFNNNGNCEQCSFEMDLTDKQGIVKTVSVPKTSISTFYILLDGKAVLSSSLFGVKTNCFVSLNCEYCMDGNSEKAFVSTFFSFKKK